jgi:hypothetical protein
MNTGSTLALRKKEIFSEESDKVRPAMKIAIGRKTKTNLLAVQQPHLEGNGNQGTLKGEQTCELESRHSQTITYQARDARCRKTN